MAGSVGEALDVFNREHFDVVLTDLGMPEVSGEELAGRCAVSRLRLR